MARRKAADVTEEVKVDAVVEEATDQVTTSAENVPAEVEKADNKVAEEPAEDKKVEEAPAEEEAAAEEPSKAPVVEKPAKSESAVKITSAAEPKVASETAKATNASEIVKNVTIYYTPTGSKVLFSNYSGVVNTIETSEKYTKVSVYSKSTSSYVVGYVLI